jgi:hypothetical protein
MNGHRRQAHPKVRRYGRLGLDNLLGLAVRCASMEDLKRRLGTLERLPRRRDEHAPYRAIGATPASKSGCGEQAGRSRSASVVGTARACSWARVLAARVAVKRKVTVPVGNALSWVPRGPFEPEVNGKRTASPEREPLRAPVG